MISRTASSPITSFARFAMYTMQKRWIASCPSMLNRLAGWNTEDKGLTGCIRSNGLAKEKAKDAMPTKTPLAIICGSDGLVPSTDMVDIV
eukprot:Skav217207  [mRNA]  locus=scaffold143:103847:105392:+ [translate_table: standard]